MELHWLSCFRDVFVWPHCECFSKRTPQLVRMGPPDSQEPCRLQVAYKAASGEEIESHKELGELSNKDLSARTSQSMQNCLQNASWSALSIEFGQQNVSKLCLSYNRSSDDSILYFILENNPCGHPRCVSQNMGIYIYGIQEYRVRDPRGFGDIPKMSWKRKTCAARPGEQFQLMLPKLQSKTTKATCVVLMRFLWGSTHKKKYVGLY